MSKQPVWTHVVSVDPNGPLVVESGTTYRIPKNHYCYLSDDHMKLLAVGDDVKAPGQVVCLWDDDKQEWFLRNDPETRILVRWKW